MGDVVLVTGGAGYIGSHIAGKLLDRGARVRVLDSLLYGDEGLREFRENRNLEVIQGDVRDGDTLARAMRDVGGVIALAALVGDAACDLYPEQARATNYESSQQTLQACRKAGVRRLVFASTCSVYGANGSEALREDSHLNPVSLYARTRLMSEEYLLREAGDVRVVILRLATVCGASRRMRFDLMVNTMTACAAVQRAIRVTAASQWRPHIHVQDAAEAFILGLEAPVARSGVFNAGSDSENFTIGDVGEKVSRCMGGVPVEYIKGSGDARSYRVSFDRIREELGFRPRYTVDDAICEVRDLLAGGVIDDFTNERFHNAKWLSVNAPARGAA